MADSEHTLHLIAKLDTSEVQQQIDKLNAGKLQTASGAAPAKGVAGSSAIGDVAVVAMASQLNKMKSQFQNVTSIMSGFSKRMTSISRALAQLNEQLALQVKISKVLFKEHLEKISNADQLSDTELGLTATLRGGKYIPPKLQGPFRNTPSDNKLSEREKHRQESLKFIRDYYSGAIGAVPNVPVGAFRGFAGDMPLFKLKWRMQSMMTSAAKYVAGMYTPIQLPGYLSYVRDMPQAGASAEAMPLYKNQLIRWGGAALGSQVLRGAGQYLEASRSPYADVVTTGGTMLQGAAMGAAAGATLGPQGAAIGAMLGTAIAATNKLFDVWTQRAREAQQEISNALKVDPNRRASISAYADMLRGLSQERELKMVSGMGTSSLDVIIERAAGKIKDIESKVDSGAYGSVQELQTLLSQRQYQQQVKQTAEARKQQIEKTREESTQRNIEEQERLNAEKTAEAQRLKAFREAASVQDIQIAWGETARQNVQKLQAMQADQDVDKGWLRSGYQQYGEDAQFARRWMKQSLWAAQQAKTSEEAQGFLASAEEARQRWTFSLGQQDFFKAGLVQTLQQQLASIKPADLSPVTSLGQYGYGMGEVNDNIDRQMQIWEEQAALQRQIKDILQDKTFEAYYAD